MKKNIFKSLLCLSVGMLFVACQDTMDDKADIDASHEMNIAVVPAMEFPANVTYAAADLTITLADSVGVVEMGFELATDAEFAQSWYETAPAVVKAYVMTVGGLAEQTTYYVRPYVYTANGTTTLGEVKSFTTEAAPIFEINGVYEAQEYNLNASYQFEAGGTYDVTVEFKEGSTTEVLVTNLWGGGQSLSGTYDAETQTITIPSGQLLYFQEPFEFIASGIDNTLTPTENITLSFTPLGGVLETSFIEVTVEGYGRQDIFLVEMKHK